MTERKPKSKEQKLEDRPGYYDWQPHTESNPFWDQAVPVEVELVDETREHFRNPQKSRARLAKEYAEIVKQWHRLKKSMLFDGSLIV